MKIITQGLITGPEAVVKALPHCSFKVRNWQNQVAPASQKKTEEKLKALGYFSESIFDAAHGRRYMLFVYSTREERKACWDSHTSGSISQH